MQRTVRTFTIENSIKFKQQLLRWSQQYDTAILLDSNNYQQQYSSFDAVLATDDFTSIKTDYHQAFKKLEEYKTTTNDYIFGYITYDVKNDIEQLSSNNFDGLNFADLYFFQPKRLIFIKKNLVEFHYLPLVDDEIEDDFKSICHIELVEVSSSKIKKTNIKSRISKETYLQKATTFLNHIKRGDIYEANFCQEFYAENTNIDPVEIYQQLNKISAPPFASFLKIEDHFLLSASPERYIRKENNKIISQPIKGTAKRLSNKKEDNLLANNLEKDEKERAENVMIVDLVRNDLSKIAKKGSVKVEELCKVYSFKQVHQLISTVVCELDENKNSIEVLKETFPMGSMTGAPKFSAMKIIEKLEETKRGLYSGTVGYFSPNDDFDFNVIIRSILYNQQKKYVSFTVGSAITSKSSPEKEYEECLLKAKALKFVLSK